MPDPRYFGISLSFNVMHGCLGLPKDISIIAAHINEETREVRLTLKSTGKYEEQTYSGLSETEFSNSWALGFFRPDIQTREVSQVVIHPLKEK